METPSEELAETLQLVLEGITIDASVVRTSPLLDYLRMVIRLIERISVTRAELTTTLLEAMRQHSIAYRTRTDYVLRFLHQHPP
jgi:hypothetical protein